MMKVDQKGIDFIKKHEGLRLKAYKCQAGVQTIGYGHTMRVSRDMEITLAQAEEYFKQDIEDAEKVVNSSVEVALNQNMFNALVSFVFNFGAKAFRGSTLLVKLNRGDYKGAEDQFHVWNKAKDAKTGKKVVLQGLKRRRWDEAKLFSEE